MSTLLLESIQNKDAASPSIYINAAGNVGIGTTSPNQKFEVEGGRSFFSANNENFAIGFRYASTHATMYIGGTNSILAPSIQFSNAGGGPLVNITYDGNVGIGTATPAAKLQVNQTTTTAPSLTFGAAAGQILQNEDAEFAFGLSNAAPYNLWMQGRYTANTPRNIAIQPLGGNVGIGTDAPSYKLEVKNNANAAGLMIHRSGLDAAGASSILAFQTTQSNAQSARLAEITSVFNSAWGGSLVLSTKPANGVPNNTTTERMQIDDTIRHYVTKMGLGNVATSEGPSGKDMQFITWNGVKGNGTIDLLSNTDISEVGVSGIIGINVTGSGQGTCRVYSFIGRYIAATLNQIQGGNRGAGEDASISLNTTGNNLGIRLNTSGYGGANHGYNVWMIAGIQITNYGDATLGQPNNKWLG